MAIQDDFLVVNLEEQVSTVQAIDEIITGRQGDHRRPLKLWFWKGPNPFSLDGYTLEWQQTNDKGENPLVVNGTTIDGYGVGQVIFYFPSQVFAHSGLVTGHFALKKQEQVISTMSMSFQVSPNEVLVGINTQPFMDDWEKFKSGIADQIDQLNKNVDSVKELSATLQSSIDTQQKAVKDGNVALKSDLDKFLAKDGNGSIEQLSVTGNLSAGAFLVDGYKNLSYWSNLTRTSNPYTESQTGIYWYDADDGLMNSNVLPPYLAPEYRQGYVMIICKNSNTKHIEWLGSGWSQDLIDGNYGQYYCNQRVPLFNGTADFRKNFKLTTKLDYFEHLIIAVGNVKMPGVHHFTRCFKEDPTLYYTENLSNDTDKAGFIAGVIQLSTIDSQTMMVNINNYSSTQSNDVTVNNGQINLAIWGETYDHITQKAGA